MIDKDVIALANQQASERAAFHLRALLRHRMGILVGLATISGFALALNPPVTSDFSLFARAGAMILKGHLNIALAGSGASVQTGPLQLLFFGAARLLSGSEGYWFRSLVEVPSAIAITIASIDLARRLATHTDRELSQSREFVLGAIVVLGGIVYEVTLSGHPAEAFLGVLWVGAAIFIRQGRPLGAGIAIGLAAALEPLGLLGIVIVLMALSVADALRASGSSALVLLVAYAPLIGSIQRSTVGYRWLVLAQSPLRFLLPVGTHFDWKLRLVQGCIIIALGAALIFLKRKTPHIVWVVPLVTLATRYLTDPQGYHYYWIPVGVIGVVGWFLRNPYAVLFDVRYLVGGVDRYIIHGHHRFLLRGAQPSSDPRIGVSALRVVVSTQALALVEYKVFQQN